MWGLRGSTLYRHVFVMSLRRKKQLDRFAYPESVSIPLMQVALTTALMFFTMPKGHPHYHLALFQ